MTDDGPLRVDFQHEKERYRATLNQRGVGAETTTWQLVHLTDDGEQLICELADGQLDRAQAELANHAEQQRALAQTHLDLADDADHRAALVNHLAERLGPPTRRTGRKTRG